MKNHEKSKEEIEKNDNEYNIRNIKIYLLKQEISKNGLYLRDGLEYLIDIYRTKIKKMKLGILHFGQLFFSISK